MPPRPMVARYVLVALRNLEARARLEGQRGQHSPDLAMEHLDWLLTEAGGHGLATLRLTWPDKDLERRDDAIIRLRDVDSMPFQAIATTLGLERSATIKAYYSVKEKLSRL